MESTVSDRIVGQPEVYPQNGACLSVNMTSVDALMER
jgi:hypothetical protein